jgi:dolichol kinase
MTTNPEQGGSGTPDSPFSSGAAPTSPGSIDYRSEIVRKAIHLNSLLIPVIYSFITRELALWLLVPMLCAALLIEVGKHYSEPFARIYYRVFGRILREHEHDRTRFHFNGATYVLLSAVICVLVFPKLITITAFAILIISDSTSALIGRRFGTRPFFRKSREGAIAFFVSAVLVVLVAPKAEGSMMEYAIGIAGAFVGMVVESASRIDDNLSIPLSVGAVMWLCYALLLPGLDLTGPAPLF